MGVDYYSCHHCGDTFPDCGEYVSCETCGTNWCSYECAKADGYVKDYCTKYDVSGYDDLEFEREIRGCDHEYCDSDCEFFVQESCKFCRGEDFEDGELLKKALSLLKMTREDLIKQMKLK